MTLNKIIPLVGALLLSGCFSHNVDKTRETPLGKYTEQTLKEKLIVGKSTKRDVLITLGQPMVPEDYNKSNAWIYASHKTDRTLILIVPVNLDKNQVLRVNFDNNNVLSNLVYTDVK